MTILTGLLLLLPARLSAADATRLAGDVDARGFAQVVGKQKGKVVLVNFWATWCVPCRQEFPDLVRLEKAYRARGVAVVGVSTDFAKELPAVEKFLSKNQPDFPNYIKKSGQEQEFIESVDPKWGGELPFSVLYARDGKKAAVLSGKHSYAELEAEIEKLLNPGQ
jgi:thiol-disulfide isomerase/thioredoxin